jgi:hypothetical protein
MPLDPSSFDPTGVDRNKPSIAVGAGLGTAPPAPTIDAQADDHQGTISFGSGSAPAAGTILTVTFARPKDANRLPKVMLQEATQAMAGIDVAVSGVTANGFTIAQGTRVVTASQAAGTYALSFLVID